MRNLLVACRNYSRTPKNCYKYVLDYFYVMSFLELCGASTVPDACAHEPSISPSPSKCKFEVMSGWLFGLSYLELISKIVGLLLM
jgi:hypothetical protein